MKKKYLIARIDMDKYVWEEFKLSGYPTHYNTFEEAEKYIFENPDVYGNCTILAVYINEVLP
jgi:hypothetical protein